MLWRRIFICIRRHVVKNSPRFSWAALFTCILLSWPGYKIVNADPGSGEVVWAVNCGGDTHTDIHGIRYQRDYLSTGIASDYGKSLIIQRVVPQDAILYQTERYHTASFGYDIPLKGDGDYVLVTKFSEVWFTAPNQKVFSVILNNAHTVTDELDIFGKVGRGSAHDEIIPFSVKSGRIHVNGDSSKIEGSKISITFAKLDRDNPKVNAMYLMKGTIDDVPQLPPLPGNNNDHEIEDMDSDEVDDIEQAEVTKKPKFKPSDPKVQDPYAADDTGSMMLPVFVTIGTFIPILFCLCKL